MGKGKKKPRKPKPRYLLVLTLGLVTFLQGCAVFDALTGADDPEVLAGTKPSPALQAVESLDDAIPAPWGWVLSGVGGAAITTYIGVRRKQKAAEGTATA